MNRLQLKNQMRELSSSQFDKLIDHPSFQGKLRCNLPIMGSKNDHIHAIWSHAESRGINLEEIITEVESETPEAKPDDIPSAKCYGNESESAYFIELKGESLQKLRRFCNDYDSLEAAIFALIQKG